MKPKKVILQIQYNSLIKVLVEQLTTHMKSVFKVFYICVKRSSSVNDRL